MRFPFLLVIRGWAGGPGLVREPLTLPRALPSPAHTIRRSESSGTREDVLIPGCAVREEAGVMYADRLDKLPRHADGAQPFEQRGVAPRTTPRDEPGEAGHVGVDP